MSIKTSIKFCPCCGQHRMFQKNIPNHLVHALLTLATMGAWMLVWAPLILKANWTKSRCMECGKGKLL